MAGVDSGVGDTGVWIQASEVTGRRNPASEDRGHWSLALAWPCEIQCDSFTSTNVGRQRYGPIDFPFCTTPDAVLSARMGCPRCGILAEVRARC